MTTTTPPTLREGDRVAIVATARKVSPEEMAPAIELLSSWGLDVYTPPELYGTHHQFAGDDLARAAMLQRVLDDNSIKAVFCARGGYGTVRIIDKIDFTAFRQSPKWVVGYSDVTVLHNHIHTHCHTATLHATMPINIPPDATTHHYPATDSLRTALFEDSECKLNASCRCRFDRQGEAYAPVVGGNLSMLYSLSGSASDIDTRGKILFIEDLDEYLYHIDRMMQQLKRCGKLDHLAGLIVGAMSDMHDNAIPFGMTANEIVWNAVSEYHYPVWFNAPYGHIGTDNKALILGKNTHFKVTTCC